MTPRAASVVAQAKLNLVLHVLAREASGYHSIETVFHRVEWGDDVTVTLEAPGHRTIECSVDVGPRDANLAWRAAMAYCGIREWTTGFQIAIDKRIPTGGGLGGGSADAAAVLRVLNAMHPNPYNASELDALARTLGADVPFLVSDAAMAFAWHHGDHMLLLPPLPQRHVALVVPDFRVSTADAYARVSPHCVPGGPEMSTFARFGPLPMRALSDWRFVGKPTRWVFGNDFHHALGRAQREEVEGIMKSLDAAGAVAGGMSGSGSTLFGVFDIEPDRTALEAALGRPVIITRSASVVEPVRMLD